MIRPYKYIYGSIKGKERKINQDRIFVLENNHLSFFMLFDGVSSYPSSFRFIEKFMDILSSINKANEILSTNLSECLYEAHMMTLPFNIEGMSTLSLFSRSHTSRNKGYILNIGDSGVYTLTNRSLEKITQDDLLPGSSNILTKALGMDSLDFEDFIGEEIELSSRILLCSDGFSTLMEGSIKEYFRVLNFKRLGDIHRGISDLQRGKNRDDASYILIDNHDSD